MKIIGILIAVFKCTSVNMGLDDGMRLHKLPPGIVRPLHTASTNECWFAANRARGNYAEARINYGQAIQSLHEFELEAENFLKSSTIKILKGMIKSSAWKTKDYKTRRLLNREKLMLFNTGNFEKSLADSLAEYIWSNAWDISTMSLENYNTYTNESYSSWAELTFIPELLMIDFARTPIGAYEQERIDLTNEEIVNFDMVQSTNTTVKYTQPLGRTTSIHTNFRFGFVNTLDTTVLGKVQAPFGSLYNIGMELKPSNSTTFEFSDIAATDQETEVTVDPCHTADVKVSAISQHLEVEFTMIFHMGEGQIAFMTGIWNGIGITDPISQTKMTNLYFC